MSRKKKIAIFHCGFIYTGGGERIVIEEIIGLRKKGYEVDCFVPTYDPHLSYPDIIKKLGIKTFLPQFPKFFPLRFAIPMLLSCLLSPILAPRFLKYDLILGANQPGAFIAWVVAGILNKPYFVYLNQPNRILYPRDHENWQNVKDYYFLNKLLNSTFRPVVSFLDKKSIISGRNLFINGKFIAREINKFYRPRLWNEAAGGAHPASLKTLRKERLSGEIRINKKVIKKPYILYTSRHEPWKKFDWAIEVVNEVISEHSDIRLVIPGSETVLTPNLKNLANQLGISDKIIFPGAINQKELRDLYENAALYIFTSPKEDLGVVVLEAQAAGVPVVAWNRGGPTVTVVNNTTGYLIEPYKFSRMAKQIVKILKNKKLHEKLSANAHKHIKDNFSWDKHVEILDKEFKKVAN